MKQITVLETNILHASDIIYWLDGSSAAQESDMLRLNHTLVMQLDEYPDDVQFLHTPGKTALWRRSSGKIIAGTASDTEKERSVENVYTLAGTVTDSQRRYIPRRFSIDAGNTAGHGVVLYPTPFGTRLGRGGGLRGTLRFDSNSSPVMWALLTLTVDLTVGTNLICRAQADGNGDFILALHRLPPLPEGINQYSAMLSIRASSEARADTPIDPVDLESMALGALDVDNNFADAITLSVVPGEIRLIRSSNKDHIAVQPH